MKCLFFRPFLTFCDGRSFTVLLAWCEVTKLNFKINFVNFYFGCLFTTNTTTNTTITIIISSITTTLVILLQLLLLLPLQLLLIPRRLLLAAAVTHTINTLAM